MTLQDLDQVPASSYKSSGLIGKVLDQIKSIGNYCYGAVSDWLVDFLHTFIFKFVYLNDF